MLKRASKQVSSIAFILESTCSSFKSGPKVSSSVNSGLNLYANSCAIVIKPFIPYNNSLQNSFTS